MKVFLVFSFNYQILSLVYCVIGLLLPFSVSNKKSQSLFIFLLQAHLEENKEETGPKVGMASLSTLCNAFHLFQFAKTDWGCFMVDNMRHLLKQCLDHKHYLLVYEFFKTVKLKSQTQCLLFHLC